MDLQAYLREQKARVDRALDRFLPPETEEPQVLHRAMRYTLFAGGKRLRPILALAAFEAAGGTEVDRVLPLACSLELIHTFSLIHDDLPAMDDDDFRRGKPSSHKVFGEGMAILAGDALFAAAFEVALQAPLPPATLVRALRELTWASGSEGMIGGQVEDLEAEGREPTPERVLRIHRKKTAALIASSLAIGGIAAQAPEVEIQVLKEAGLAMGLAFQIVDDLLDEIASDRDLGKRAHKDRARGKCTYPRVFGLERSREDARAYARQAKEILARAFGPRSQRLQEIADFIVERSY